MYYKSYNSLYNIIILADVGRKLLKLSWNFNWSIKSWISTHKSSATTNYAIFYDKSTKHNISSVAMVVFSMVTMQSKIHTLFVLHIKSDARI